MTEAFKNELSGKYRYIKLIGKSLYGYVCMAIDCKTEGLVAIKVISRVKYEVMKEESEPPADDYKIEMSVLNEMKGSRRIVQVLEFVESKDFVYIVMEYLNDDLFNFAEANLTEAEIAVIGIQIIEGIQTLEARGWCNLDIALENVGVRKQGSAAKPHDWDVCLIDMGCIYAKVIKPELFNKIFKGTLPGRIKYQAPEVVDHFSGHINPKYWNISSTQVWTLGVSLFCLGFGIHPYKYPGDEYWRRKMDGSWLHSKNFNKLNCGDRKNQMSFNWMYMIDSCMKFEAKRCSLESLKDFLKTGRLPSVSKTDSSFKECLKDLSKVNISLSVSKIDSSSNESKTAQSTVAQK